MSPIESIWAVFKIFKFAKWSPHVRASTTVLESGFQVLDSNLCQWNLESGFQLLVGFRTPWAAFRIPKPRIPYSASTIFPDSSFRSTSKNFRESKIRIPLHRVPIALSSRDHSWIFFFLNALWRSLLGSWTRYLWGKVSAKDVVAKILAGYLETVGTGSQRVPCFFALPLSSEVLPGKQQELVAFFGGGQIWFPLLQINSLTGNKWVYKLLTFGWC